MLVRVLFAVLTLSSAVAFAATGNAYSSVITDLPLAPGLDEQEDQAVVFDTPAGRIVEIFAQSPAPPIEVEAFYAQTLPALGWMKAGTGVYARDDEVLRIAFDDQTVHFSLSPEGN